MPTTINGNTGIDRIQNGTVLPEDTQVGALPSMVRLHTANGYGSTNTVIRRFTNVVTNQGSDISYADSATLGATFTINTNGVYAFSYTDSFNASSQFGLSLNSNQLTSSITAITAADRLADTNTGGATVRAQIGWTGYLPAGSVVRAHGTPTPNSTAPELTNFCAVRVA